jgi:hypothetical protein
MNGWLVTCSKIFLHIVNTRKDYSILIGSVVPDINYFLTLIKHYFFSQFYNYKKNKSLQIKAFSKLKPSNISIIHKGRTI